MGNLNGQLYLCGGWQSGGGLRNNVYRFDGTTWTEVSSMPLGYNHAMGVGVLGSYLYTVGGYNGGSGYTTNVYRFDGTTWTSVAGLPSGRSSHGVATLGNYLYAVGGGDSSVRTNVYRYNGTSWTEVAGLPAAREYLGCAALDNYLYAIGGRYGSTAYTNVYRFDGTSWIEVAGLPAPRFALHAGTFGGYIYAVSGSADGTTAMTNVFRFNGSTWTEVAGLPVGRFLSSVGVLNDKLYAAAGDSGSGGTTNVFRLTPQWVTHGYKWGWDGIGNGSWQYTFTDTGNAIEGRVWGPTSGNTYGSEAWWRTSQNFNDGNFWQVTFTLDATIGYTPHYDPFGILISDTNYTDTIHSPLIYSNPPSGSVYIWRNNTDTGEAGTDTPQPPFSNQTWTVLIDPAGKAKLYQSDGVNGSPYRTVTLDLSKPWHLKFELGDATSSGFTAGDNTLRVRNFSTTFQAIGPPSGVSASDGTYSDKVRVTWNAVDNATGYQVWRNSTDASGSAGLLTATTAVSYDDSSVSANVIYYYWVKATNATSTSGFSASDSGYAFSTTSSPAISAPMGVSASDGTYTDKVAMSWTSVSDASSYEVWRATSNNTSVASNLAATTSTNYDDTSVVGGATYYYWVKAKSLTAVSAFSDPDSGYAALSAFSGYANLEVSDVILLPTTLDVGGHPGAAGLQLMNWGPDDMTTPDTRVILDFFLSPNTTFGDADDLWLGDYQTDATLSAGSYTLLAVTAAAREGFTVPSGAVGTNYVFGRARHTYPSTLGDSDESNNHAMRSGTIKVVGSGETPSSGYHVINDYDGDGKSDLALYRKTSGEWIILLSGSEYQTATAVLGGQGYKPALADYDGDGKSDLVVYHQATGQWTFMLSASGYVTATLVMGGSGYVPVPADYDGDGKADPIVYQESSGLWQILQSASSYAPLNVSLGGNGYKAVAADFDGDGKSDIAVYRRSTGDWQIMLSSLEYWTTEFRFGGSGQVPAPADYDADGKTDPAVYKESSGEWNVMMSKYSYLTATATFGGNGYVAVPADYDGDGKGDVVVYSESAGELKILLSGSGYTQTVVTIGGPGYEPVGYYDW
ncbi:MAG: VCBS repeat-containing protein [Lentisphaerae bacterium]|nr:VCBS repeat-containing protein [Lentisphaerota bacterium]